MLDTAVSAKVIIIQTVRDNDQQRHQLKCENPKAPVLYLVEHPYCKILRNGI